MKSLKFGTLASLLFGVGIGVSVIGFLPAIGQTRIAVQLIGLAMAAAGVYLWQRLISHWHRMLQDD